MVGDTLNATRRSTFLSAEAYPEKMVDNGAETWDVEESRNNFT